jgi:uncharacterized protein DUF1828
MTEDAANIQQLLRDHVAGEIVCATTTGEERRIECLTPLEYPSGDAISIWVETYADRYVVTDYGESLADLALRPPQDHKVLDEAIAEICAPLGLSSSAGKVEAETSHGELADAVWRCATAASLIAQASAAFRPPRRQLKERHFVSEVEHALQDRHVPVEREHKLAGASGHKYTATIYLPHREAVLEPIGGNWNQINAVYAKFGDLSKANGYSLYSLVDDREHKPVDDASRILLQVSKVVEWSRRDEWIAHLH